MDESRYLLKIVFENNYFQKLIQKIPILNDFSLYGIKFDFLFIFRG